VDHEPTVRVLLILGLSVITLYGWGLVVTDMKSLLISRFTRSEVLGFVAGFGTTFAAVPDLVAMLRRGSSNGHEPEDGRDHGDLPDRLGLLRVADRLATRDPLERQTVATNFFSVGAYLYYARRERRSR
jgi:MtN3 and saliva related transmembrane protein